MLPAAWWFGRQIAGCSGIQALTFHRYGVWDMVMKITLELPDGLGRRFRATVPNGQRSRLVAELLAKCLRGRENSLERAAKKANTFKQVNAEMKDWEALNETED